MNERLDMLYRSEARLGQMVSLFASLSILVACLGLFGLASFSAEQRTKEIGIRKVLGASVSDVVLILSREFIALVLVANLIAWPIAYFVIGSWLENFHYRIAMGPSVFLLGSVLTIVIAALAVGVQSVKAATRDPVTALRYG